MLTSNWPLASLALDGFCRFPHLSSSICAYSSVTATTAYSSPVQTRSLLQHDGTIISLLFCLFWGTAYAQEIYVGVRVVAPPLQMVSTMFKRCVYCHPSLLRPGSKQETASGNAWVRVSSASYMRVDMTIRLRCRCVAAFREWFRCDSISMVCL